MFQAKEGAALISKAKKKEPAETSGLVDLSGSPWRMHEFFAGSGLVAYGMQGLFSPVWSNDVSETKAKVYRANFVSNHFVQADIKTVKGGDLPPAHLSWASFPCQDLSLAGAISGIRAARSGLVWEWLRILDEMPEKPKILALENVIGLLSAHQGENYRLLHRALAERGYRAGAVVLNASHFVPQSRPRVFVIAVAKDCEIPAELVGAGPSWLHNRAAAELGKALQAEGWIWWKTPEPAPCPTRLEDLLEADAPHDKDQVLKFLSDRHREKLAEYESFCAAGYRRTREGEQVLELRFDGIAGCLRTPGGGSSKQYVVLKNGKTLHARLLTLREVARLMGAPDRFRLPGSYNDGYAAMGDAVALPAARFIGERFLARLAAAAYGTAGKPA